MLVKVDDQLFLDQESWLFATPSKRYQESCHKTLEML